MQRTSLEAVGLAAILTALAILGTRNVLAAERVKDTSAVVQARHSAVDQVISYGAPNSTCPDRPSISVAVSMEAGRLRATLSSRTSAAVPANTLKAVRFGEPRNGRIILQDQSTTSAALSVALTSNPVAYTFYVEKISDGSVTVPLTIVDACGDWTTFVGHGGEGLRQIPAPTPTATPSPPPVAMHEGVPVCTDHDATRWHPLVKKDGAGRIVCAYGHEHHDDPNAVNDIFGSPSAWFGGTQAISYPWQTFSAAGMENHVKHEGYKWYVQRNVPCKPFGGSPGCIVAWRVQVHTLGSASDAVTRFHSYGLEAVVELNGQRGIVRHGGWIDTGHLALLADGGRSPICPGVASDRPGFVCQESPKREHSGANVPAPHSDHASYMVNWYSQHQISQITPRLEEWGPVDYQQPDRQLFYPAAVRANNSRGRIENMAVVTLYSWFQSYTGADGLVRYNGYTLRDGTPVGGCTSPGYDCVPLVIEAAPASQFFWNAINAGMTDLLEYDVPSPVTGNSLIRFPN